MRRTDVYGCKPVAVLAVLAGDDVEEGSLDGLGHRARLAGADGAAVELADRRHLRRGAGEEALVGDVEVVPREALGVYLVAQALRQLDHRAARDAGERRGELGLPEGPILDHEDILAGAFGNKAVDVEQQALVVAVLRRLQRREHRV